MSVISLQNNQFPLSHTSPAQNFKFIYFFNWLQDPIIR